MVQSVQNPAVIIVKLITIVTILMDTVVVDAKVDIPGQNVIEVGNTNHCNFINLEKEETEIDKSRCI
jgi:fumarate reductase subunit C